MKIFQIKLLNSLKISAYGFLLVILVIPAITWAKQPTNTDTWNQPFNISRSPDSTSTDPFLLADPAGKVHLFWSEKLSNFPGNQPDTIMYTSWDGELWTAPIETFINPPDLLPSLHYPEAVMDNEGMIHLIWTNENAIGASIFYSKVHSNLAGTPSAWSAPVEISPDAEGTNYSLAIAYSPPSTIYIIFAKGLPVQGSTLQRAVTYHRSLDGGATWEEPVDIATVADLKHGASNTRLLVEPPNRIYASWSEWNEDGNGQGIHFTRSLDGGDNWETSKMITETRPGEYERDWNNLALLGEGQLVSIWEGGFRAYRHAMYSSDGGVTWTDPIDTFPWLIGENGFVKYATDSLGQLHLFIAQRVREGNTDRDVGGVGLWHSIWEGGTTWRDPVLIGGVNDMVNPAAVIVNGNEVVAAWYASSVIEIMVMTGQLGDTPPTEPQPWPDPGSSAEPTATPIDATSITPVVEVTAEPGIPLNPNPPQGSDNPGSVIFLGIVPAVLILGAFLVIRQFRQGS